MKKATVILFVISVLILLFVDRCTTINLTTADIFRPSNYNDFKELPKRPQSQNYEIVPAQGDFPLLYNSSQNEFYLSNGKGLTKYDGAGNLIFTNDLSHEEYTSTFDFSNFVPYVFAKNGVYDYSGEKLVYSRFSEILNANNEMDDKDFKSIFESHYKNAELVIYDNDRNIESGRDCLPMYFMSKGKWILIFTQKGDYRFTHQGNGDIDNDTIGKIDFLGFPAKFADKGLMVLKDSKNGIYSINKFGREKINDDYLNTFYTQILKERKMDYQTDDEIKLLSHRKEEYYSTGNIFSLPSWVSPSFMNTGYFKLTYRGENIFFKEKAIKLFSDPKVQNDLYLFELPKKSRSRSKIAFVLYELNVGGYMNDSTGIVEPIIKNTGLYLIKPKK